MTMGEKTVLVIGATSDIGRAIARRFATEGSAIQLAARDAEALKLEGDDLSVRGSGNVASYFVDVAGDDGGVSLVGSLDPLPDIAICVIGFLGDQRLSESNPQAAEQVMQANFTGPVLLMGALAEKFAERGSGTLVGVSSVAGDRGRASNYLYGASKAGFTAFLSGLRNRLVGDHVHVVTVKPGFVRTRMTDGMDLPDALTAEPDEVADAVFEAVSKGKNVIYVKPVWRLIMLVIRSIPEWLFKKLSL